MAEFILKDWYGKEQTFDKETIYVRGKDGNLIPFKEKPTLQEKTITENGEYTADAGFDGLGKVLVEVAGAGGAFKFKTGEASATSSTDFTMTHNCGVVPDIVIVCPGSFPSSGYFGFAVGYSKAMLAKMTGSGKSSFVYTSSSGSSLISANDTNGIDADTNNSYYKQYGGIINATATTFKIGGSKGMLKTGSWYTYYAIYGLTE
jgi:hypothetical protein